MKMHERYIQAAIIDYFTNILRLPCYRRNVGAMRLDHKGKSRLVRFSQPGAADLWFIARDGVHGECEVKRPGQKPTEAQVLFLSDVAKAGGIAILAHSLEECAQELERQYRRRGWIWRPDWRVST